MCTPYDRSHGLPLLLVGETDLQIVVGGVAHLHAVASTTTAPQPLQDGPQGGLQRVVRGVHGGAREGRRGRLRGGVVRGRAQPALRVRHHRLESPPPQPLEYYPIVIATRRSATLHLNI